MKREKKVLLILGMMAFLANGDNYAAAPLLVNIAKDLNLTVSKAATSVTAYMLAFGAFTIFFGPLSDRYGKVRLINIAAIGTSIFSMLGALTFNLHSLTFFRFMNGAFGAGITPITFALIGEIFEEKSKQKAMSQMMGYMFLGAATASIIGGAIAYIGSWRLVYLIYGVGEFILAIIMFKNLERDEPINKKLNIISSYKDAFTNFKFVRNSSLIFLVGIGVYGSFTYSGQLIHEITKLNALYVGAILSTFGIGTVVGGKIISRLKELFKEKFLIVAGLLGGGSLFLISWGKTPLILVLAFFGFGIAYNLSQSSLIFMSQKELPKQKGTAMSVSSFNLFTGGALGITIGGYFVNLKETSQIFVNTGIIFLIITIFATIILFKDKKAQENQNLKIS